MESETRMSYVDIAIAVLDACRRPMTAREITEEAIRRGVLKPVGKTPELSMAARLYVYARDNPSGPLVRLYEPGRARAVRGSVRWTLRNLLTG